MFDLDGKDIHKMYGLLNDTVREVKSLIFNLFNRLMKIINPL